MICASYAGRRNGAERKAVSARSVSGRSQQRLFLGEALSLAPGENGWNEWLEPAFIDRSLPRCLVFIHKINYNFTKTKKVEAADEHQYYQFYIFHACGRGRQL